MIILKKFAMNSFYILGLHVLIVLLIATVLYYRNVSYMITVRDRMYKDIEIKECDTEYVRTIVERAL